MGSLQSTILGFLAFRVVANVLHRHKYMHTPFSPLENVVLQTAAVATATMPLAGGNCTWGESENRRLMLFRVCWHYPCT